MLVNILLGGIIFGYASFTFIKHIQKSKQGKCAACAVKNTCQSEAVCASKVTNNK
ncbi:FeoB-associated Cys-rich membrane protein [Robertmurraya korlensis]|jgi:hypothetical protein|uniref:FeoB-associated Cys-rich membrane protein n=1 Tax=Robertmurraya korlensis TaxID=519977 RepID=UPI000826BD4D|nr:FeoB-associated Cys-rich membrane protein [Robertmurraya korlensis]